MTTCSLLNAHRYAAWFSIMMHRIGILTVYGMLEKICEQILLQASCDQSSIAFAFKILDNKEGW